MSPVCFFMMVAIASYNNLALFHRYRDPYSVSTPVTNMQILSMCSAKTKNRKISI